MTFLGYEVSKVTLGNGSDKDTFQEACHALGKAVGNHDVGETTAKIQDLIMRYYTDVRGQSSESFRSAKNVALFGFILFAATIAYLVFTDVMLHLHQPWFTESEKGMGVGAIGLISGSVVELIAEPSSSCTGTRPSNLAPSIFVLNGPTATCWRTRWPNKSKQKTKIKHSRRSSASWQALP